MRPTAITISPAATLLLIALAAAAPPGCRVDGQGPAIDPAPAPARAPGDPSAQRPNIVLILADDLGIGDLGCYNAKSRIPTPQLDAFAAQSRRFTDAHSPSGVCTPTRYGLLTGRYAWRTHLQRSVLWGDSPLLIEPQRATLASLCKQAGYSTACFGKWHLGIGGEEGTDYNAPLRPGPLECGFDTFEGIPASAGMPPYVWVIDDRPEQHATEKKQLSYPVRGYGGEGFWRPGPAAPGFDHADTLPRTIDRSIEWIGERADEPDPFFLYIALSAPHTPWLPAAAFEGTTGAGPYGDFVANIDDEVGRVLASLEAHDLVDETLVIFTSDNGAHWEPQDIAQYGHRANLNFRGQKGDAWEGGHHIPFLLRWPGRVQPRTSEERLFSLTDVFATLARLFDTEIPSGAAPDSIDATPLWFGNQAPESRRRAMVHHSFEGVFAMRSGRFKFIEGLGSGGFSDITPPKAVPGGPTDQLYDLSKDPQERTNLFQTQPKIVARLREELAAARSSE